jgi:hypothetical protein
VIPPLTPDGNLPKGIHVAPWPEIGARYATTGHRRALLAGFLRGTKILVSAGCRAVYLDGSFVTAKTTPKDYDACWELNGADLVLLKRIEPVFFKFDNERAAQKAKFMGEFFPAEAAAHSHRRTFLEFFQTDKTTGLPKGIIKVDMSTLP